MKTCRRVVFKICILVIAVFCTAYSWSISVSPSTSYNGSYTVSWSQPLVCLYACGVEWYVLQENIGGQWVTDESGWVQGATSRSFASQSNGTHTYRIVKDSFNYWTFQHIYQVIEGPASVTVTILNPPATPSGPSSNYSGSYSISWSGNSIATSYQLQERLNSGGWNTIYNSSGTSSARSGKSVGSWTYRVRSCANGGGICSGWSGVKTVQVNAPAAPGAPGGPNTNYSGSYTVNWNSVSNAASYQLQEKPSSGSYTTVYNSSGTSAARSSISEGGWVYRVRACSGAGCSGWSATKTVQVYVPSAPATPTGPGTNYTGSYSINWGAVTNATSYQLQESLNSGGWSTIHNASSVSKSRSALNVGTWTYRARACSGAGCSGWSPTKAVQINLPAAPSVPTAPSENFSGSYSVSWNTTSGATSYELQEQLNSGSWSTVHNSSGASVNRSGRTTGAWKYRVRACSNLGCSGWSSTTAVQVIILGTPPTLTGPSLDYSGVYTIGWNSITNATSYQLQEQLGSGSWITVYSSAGTSSARSVTQNGSWNYRVRGCAGSGCGSWSTIKTVVVSDPLVPNTPVGPTTSNTGIYTLSWSPVPSGSTYELQKQLNGGSWSVAQNNSSTSANLSGVNQGTWTYRVRACTGVGCSAWSGSKSIQVFLTPATLGVPTGPSTNYSGSYTVEWGSDQASTSYQLQEKLGGGSWSTVYDSTGTSFGRSSQGLGSWAYRVRGCNSSSSVCSSWSGTKTVQVSTPTVPSSLSVPSIDYDGSFDVSWNAVANASSYQLQEKQSGGSWITIHNAPGDTKSRSGFGNGSWEYRLAACGGVGCSAWSSTKTVTVSIIVGPSGSEAPAAMPTVSQGDIDHSARTGSTQGSFRVSEAGAATYSIPIMTPAGTAGVAPEVSLNYSSQGGNGLMGLGWSMSGSSAITRCRKSLGHDNDAEPIRWNSTDRYCLDGQRLLKVSGTHGAIGAIYKTEIDQFKTITIVNGDAGGLAFEVKAKDGSISEFGNTSDSRQLAGANVLTWAVSRFEDSAGNPIKYIYGDGGNGFRLEEIRYAYGSGSTANAVIDFEYVTGRPDAKNGFIGGYSLATNTILDRISVFNNNSEARSYQFGYKNVSGLENKTSRLESIEECAQSICLDNPTTFYWENSSTGFEASPGTIAFTAAGHTKVVDRLTTDITGDGILDLVWLSAEFNSAKTIILNHKIYFSIGQSDNTFGLRQQAFYSSQQTPIPFKIKTLDYNADGRGDIAFYDNNSWNVMLAYPDGNGNWSIGWPGPSPIATGITREEVVFIDVNSDGLADAVSLEDNQTQMEIYVRKLIEDTSQSTSSNHFYKFDSSEQLIYTKAGTQLSGYYSTFDLRNPADYNGDGIVDLLISEQMIPSGCNGYCFPSQGFFVVALDENGQSAFYSSVGGGTAGGTHAGDFNGDGLPDMVVQDAYSQASFKINTGTGFSSTVLVNEGYWGTSSGILDVLDYNEDGHDDLIIQETGTSSIEIGVMLWDNSINNFQSFSSIKSISFSPDEDSALVADVTGDGVLDLMHLAKTQVSLYAGTGSAVGGVVTSITNGLGAVTEISYAPLTLGENYSRYSAGITGAPADFWGHIYLYGITNDFYDSINGDWELPAGSDSLGKIDPVLEFAGPILVVTNVEGSAPTADPNDDDISSISYAYAEAKLQASGRGYLGFHKIKTIDDQSGIETINTYRQDFPFIGAPLETVVHTADGYLLSKATNIWKLKGIQSGWAGTAKNQGSAALGSLVPYLAETSEETYDLANNGASQGALLSKVITKNGDVSQSKPAYDAYGNLLYTYLETQNGNGAIIKTLETENAYGSTVWDQKMGRLSRSDVTATVNSDSKTLSSEFQYYLTNHGDPDCASSLSLQGLLCKEIIEPDNNALKLTTHHQYDTWGNNTTTTISSEGPELPRYTQTIYDSTGRYIDRTYNSLGQLVSQVITRNNLGQPSIVEDINGARSYSSYDAFGGTYLTYAESGAYTIKLASACPAGGCVGVPGSAFKVTEQISGSSLVGTIQYFNVLARSVRTSNLQFDGTYAHVDIKYDDSGRVVFKSEPHTGSNILWTTLQYDLLGRVIYTSLPDGSEGFTDYDGHSFTKINDLGQSKTETQNVLGQLVEVTDHINGKVTYQYDTNGNLRFVNSLGNGDVPTSTIQVCYDKLGRKTALRDPDKGGFVSGASNTCPTNTDIAQAGWWVYSYNAFGELTSQIDTKGQKVVMSYDKLGRMESRIDYQANSSVQEGNTTWTYDTALNGFGLIETIEDSISGYREDFVYDNFSRLDEAHKAFTANGVAEAYMTSTYYDSYSRVSVELDALDFYTGLSGVAYTYNDYGYQNTTTDLATDDIVQTIQSQNARGQVASELRGNGVGSTYNYFEATGLIRRQTASLANVLVVQDQEYQWDTVGNLDWRTNHRTNLTESFAYDGLNRLISSTINGVSKTVQYTSNGNISYKSGVGSYTYGGFQTGTAGPHAVTHTSVGNIGYLYDNNGNLEADDTGRNLGYTTFDKPSQITKGNHTTQFEYGASRSRYLRVDSDGVNTITTQYLGNIERIENTATPNTIEWKRYINGVAIYTVTTDNVNYGMQGIDEAYIYADHLGSTDVITDGYGAILESMSFDPWGQRRDAADWTDFSTAELTDFMDDLRGSVGDSASTRGYTGHEMLDEVGLIHMNGRIYDPKLGRFMQADPFVQVATSTQNYNRYSYVMNNPLNKADPSGYYFTAVVAIFLALAEVEAVHVMIVIGVAAFTEAMINGASFGEALFSGFVSGVSGAAFAGIGSAGGGTTFLGFEGLAGTAARGLAMGLVGGVTSVVGGGKFGDGFVNAGFGGVIGSVAGGVIGKVVGAGKGISQFLGSVIAGGTVSKKTGGKFKNGAMNAAFSWVVSYGFNIWKTDSGTLYEVTVDGENLHEREVSVDEAEIEHLFVNGQSNNVELAVKNGYDQLGKPSSYHVYYNPTRTGGIDTVESAFGTLAGSSNVAKELSAILVKNSTTLKTVAAHSQGAIIVSNALEMIPGQLTKNTTFSFFGPAAPESRTRSAVLGAGATHGQWKAHDYDFVGQILGGGASNPREFFGSIISFPKLFMGPNISPHSTYHP